MPESPSRVARILRHSLPSRPARLPSVTPLATA